MKNKEQNHQNIKCKRIISCGFLVLSKGKKILLGRATQQPDPFCFTLFKGQQEPNETYIETAIRELKEETGIDVAANHSLNRNISTNPVYSFGMKGKDVYIFLLDDEDGVLDNQTFFCESCWGNPPRPEISEYRWVSPDDVKEMIFPSQRGIIDALRAKRII